MVTALQTPQQKAVAYLADKPGSMLMFLKLKFRKSLTGTELIAPSEHGIPFAVRYTPAKGLWEVADHGLTNRSPTIAFPTVEQTVEYITRKWW